MFVLPFLILSQKTRIERHKQHTSLSEKENSTLAESQTFQLAWYARGLQRNERCVIRL